MSNDVPRKKWDAGTYGLAAAGAGLIGAVFLVNASKSIGIICLVLAVAWGAIAVIATANKISRD